MRIPAAVPGLVMVQRDSRRTLKDLEPPALEYPVTNDGVRLHQRRFGCGQPLRLGQQLRRQADLPDVVQGRRQLQQSDLLLGQTVKTGKQATVVAHSLQVRRDVRLVRLAREPEPRRELEAEFVGSGHAHARPFSMRSSGTKSRRSRRRCSLARYSAASASALSCAMSRSLVRSKWTRPQLDSSGKRMSGREFRTDSRISRACSALSASEPLRSIPIATNSSPPRRTSNASFRKVLCRLFANSFRASSPAA